MMRSGIQTCPISGYTGPLVEHHINGREVRDAEGEWNRVWLSPNMHELVHLGRLIIEGWFKTTSGRELIWHYADEESITGEDSEAPTYSKQPDTRSSAPAPQTPL